MEEIELDWDSVEVTASNLSFELDLPTNDLRIRKGSLVLGIDEDRRYESLQPVVKEEEGIKIFKAKFFYEAVADLYTVYTIADPYGDPFSIRQDKSQRWLRMYTSECPSTPNAPFGICNWKGPFDYSFTYVDYDLSQRQLLGYQNQWVIAQVAFDDQIPDSLELFGGVEYDIKTINLDSFVQRIVLTDSQDYDIGQFDVYFVGTQDAEVREDSVTEGTPNAAQGDANIADQLTILGVNFDGITQYRDSSFSQQGVAEATEGTLKEYEEGKYIFTSSLAPAVNLWRQRVPYVRQDYLIVDTKFPGAGIHEFTGPRDSTSLSHTIGWDITNKLLRLNFVIEVDIWATVEVEFNSVGNIEEPNIPDYYLSDIYWNNFIGGTTQVFQQLAGPQAVDFLEDLFQTDIQTLFSTAILVLLGVGVVYIFLTVILPILPTLIQRSILRRTE